MKNDQPPALREGERVALGFDAGAAHLFDAGSGLRLQAQPTDTKASTT